MNRSYEFRLGAEWRPHLDHHQAFYRQPPKLVLICQWTLFMYMLSENGEGG